MHPSKFLLRKLLPILQNLPTPSHSGDFQDLPITTFSLGLLPPCSPPLQFIIYISLCITNAGDKLPSVNAE